MSRKFRVGLAVGILAGAVGSSAIAAPSADEPLFYNISTDAGSLQLLALSDSGELNGKQRMDVIDVFRSPRMMTTNTWQIDCRVGQMKIVHAVSVQPGTPVNERDVRSAAISVKSSTKSAKIAELACTGGGNLEKGRVYRGDLFEIVKAFWAGGR